MGQHIMLNYLRQNPEIDVSDLVNIYVYFKFRAYLETSLIQTQKNYRFRKSKMAARYCFMPPDELCELSDFVNTAGIDESRHDIRRAMKTLNPVQCEIITLYFFHGKTDLEISSDKGVTRQAVNNIKRRALGKLKEYFEERTLA